MELIYYPNPVLRKRALPLETIDDEVRERVAEMLSIMYRERGIGLAAPQVAWSVRLFVMNTRGETDRDGEKVFIHPEILRAEGEVLDEEGCLSIPEVRGKVLRSEKVLVRALDPEGNAFQDELTDLEARVFQHEYDHLDGILFLSMLSASDRLLVGKELKKLEKEYKKTQGVKVGR